MNHNFSESTVQKNTSLIYERDSVPIGAHFDQPPNGPSAFKLSGGGSTPRTNLGQALLDSIVHELCTPLTALRVAASLLMTQPRVTKKKQAELCAIVDKESVRLERLIRRVSEMARIESASIRVATQPVSLCELLDRLLEEAHAWVRWHRVSIHISDTLPLILMDRDLVTRVLRHLLENAARYSPPGSLILITGRIADDRLSVTVADDGPGIDAAEQPFIFDKFFRGKNHKQQLPGSGMGLAIAKALIEAHGGGIGVVSSHGCALNLLSGCRLTMS